MIILIDGYNLLKSISPNSTSNDQERRAFLKMLSSYAYRKKHRLIVVFDAGPYEWAYKEKINGVAVVYSGRFQTADEFIMEYLDEHYAKETLLVSSDNEIGRHASDLEVPSIGSQDFFKVIQDVLCDEHSIADQEVSVTLESDTQDLDTIMQEGSRHVPIKQEDLQPSTVKISSKKMSRAEKKLYTILKKL